MSSIVFNYLQISSNIINFLQISSNINNFLQKSSNINNFLQISSNIINYLQISLIIFKYHQISSIFFKYHQLSTIFFKYHQLSSILDRQQFWPFQESHLSFCWKKKHGGSRRKSSSNSRKNHKKNKKQRNWETIHVYQNNGRIPWFQDDNQRVFWCNPWYNQIPMLHIRRILFVGKSWIWRKLWEYLPVCPKKRIAENIWRFHGFGGLVWVCGLAFQNSQSHPFFHPNLDRFRIEMRAQLHQILGRHPG